MSSLQAELGERSALFGVYLREAHPTDEWPLGDHVNTPTHQNIEERLKAARAFQRSTPLPLYADSMADTFCSSTWRAHPERFFVVSTADMRLAFKAQPREGGYDLEQLRQFFL